jgi:hypothetical protein
MVPRCRNHVPVPINTLLSMQVLTLSVIDFRQSRIFAGAMRQMALTGFNSPASVFDPARAAKNFRDSHPPQDALGRLFALHQEAGRNLHLSQFLARSPVACVLLMLIGALALLWADLSGGGTPKADFA